MIKHIVMWKLAESAEGGSRDENAQEMKTMLEALSAAIPELEALEVGLNFAEGEAAFDIVLYTAFASREALETYRVHPDHVKAATFIGAVTANRHVVDYEI